MWASEPPSETEWLEWWRQIADAERASALVRDVAWTSRLNAGFLLAAGLDPLAVHARLVAIHPAAAAPPVGASSRAWLLRRGVVSQPYPHSLDEPDARSAASLLEAMRISAGDAGVVGPVASDPAVAAAEVEAESLRTALRSRLARLKKRRAALERQLSEGPPSDELRETGQLLLTRKSTIPRGAVSIRLAGFDGTTRAIDLDPALDVVGNAERYFQRARRRERAERHVPARIEESLVREKLLAEALRRLAADGPTEELWNLAGGREATTTSAVEPGKPPGLPYRRLLSRGGREIRVGRSARGNDDLTFRHSSPDDIWLHVRQAPGAHVILRWGRKEQNPPESELRDAALVAAEFSDARFSGMVPVDWTRRKYVRKPRKSPPGTVIPDRVRTIFVEPDPDRVREMKETGPDAP